MHSQRNFSSVQNYFYLFNNIYVTVILDFYKFLKIYTNIKLSIYLFVIIMPAKI